ncbi:shikimate kinase [Alkalisalibacterium limincola]|uniref:Shikimate kinase n=1 Tax=Alkalisalibacterium limincola TaxID=2699169 RepID=A0A5C8KR50_9GAMM|nr:shikimate kinase [Alkalisalibacterium limincola]TXK62659.1 shikimate kinase [Alkalisalibacterium limincola]
MNPAPNLVFVGPMGAGKTSVGRRVAQHLGLEFVDTDQLLEARTGASVPLIFELEGEPGFRQRERALVAELCAREGLAIATGGGAVLDPANREVVRARGFVVHLHVSVDEQLRRLARDRHRPLLQTPDRQERLLVLARQRQALYEEVADLRFEGGQRSVAQSARRLLSLIQDHWHPGPTDKETAT